MDYPGLQTAVSGFLDSSAAKVLAMIPTAITLAEAQMNRQLRVRRMVVRAAASIDSEFSALPSDFAGPISIILDNGHELDCLSPDAMAGRKRIDRLCAGLPRAYAIVGSEIQVSPVPGAAVNATMAYYQQVPPLSADNPSNWLLQNFPDAYLYGSLVQMGTFLISASMDTWAALYKTAVEDIQSADAEVYGSRLTPIGSVGGW